MGRNTLNDLATLLVQPRTLAKGARLLSLDGGGIRGLSSLIILRELMKEVKKVESLSRDQANPPEAADKRLPKPCHYFDLIGGTSTGGIIALMLGRLEMHVEDAITCYRALSKDVFGKKKWWLSDGKYMATKLEEVIRKTVTDSHQQSTKLRNVEQRCKTFVCARNADQNSLVMMCSFERSGGEEGRRLPVSQSRSDQPFHEIDRHYHDPNLEIWQAARATSAAPTFFKPMRIEDVSYVDGGLGFNNPSLEVLDEGEDLFEFSIPGSVDDLACFLSIGTGETNVVTAYNWKRSLFQRMIPMQTIRALRSIVTDCDSTHERLTRRFRYCENKYFRFNVEKGMENVGLDDWKKTDHIITKTEEYIQEVLSR